MADRRDVERRESTLREPVTNFPNNPTEFDIRKYIRHWSLIKLPAIGYGRSSVGSKGKQDTIKRQIIEEASKKSIRLKEDEDGNPLVFVDVCSGKNSKFHKRKGLLKAIWCTERGKYPILVYSPSRLLRSELYCPVFNPTATPSKEEYEDLSSKIPCGVKFYSILDPTISGEDDDREVKRCLEKTRSSKPTIVDEKMKLKSYAVEMRNKGMSYDKVAKRVSDKCGFYVSKCTVNRWVNSPV